MTTLAFALFSLYLRCLQFTLCSTLLIFRTLYYYSSRSLRRDVVVSHLFTFLWHDVLTRLLVFSERVDESHLSDLCFPFIIFLFAALIFFSSSYI